MRLWAHQKRYILIVVMTENNSNIPYSADKTKEIRAAYLRERVYGGVTLLGVSASLLVNNAYITTEYALAAIVTATLGIGIASIFAELVAYRVVHDKDMPRQEFVHHLVTHRALLVAALPSLIFLPAAAIGIVSLKTALAIDIALGIFGLSIILIRSAVTQKNTARSVAISLLIQAIIVFLIVGLKLVG